jgi:hypothetical protein
LKPGIINFSNIRVLKRIGAFVAPVATIPLPAVSPKRPLLEMTGVEEAPLIVIPAFPDETLTTPVFVKVGVVPPVDERPAPDTDRDVIPVF